ncbi:MAG TPA: hypothetical protein VKO20_02145 [Desulfosalsimonadaceae bacterium]|nr:hypothetical protein [Desulfosalsimonadaceae bacterium]
MPFAAAHIRLAVRESRLPVFYELLAAGFFVDAPQSCSIRQLLTDVSGMDAEYAEYRIQTVFVNGRAVDDFDSPLVGKDAVVALSAAMPGLVGAVLRRGSPLGSMRGVGADKGAPGTEMSREVPITLKLFNQVAAELGPGFLAAGIRIPTARLADFLAKHPDLAVEAVQAGGKNRPAADLPEVLAGAGEYICLFVKIAE